MHYLNKAMINLCAITVLIGCSSKDMKQLGGNMMTTAGGSPIGTLVGVGLGGVIYGLGASMEDTAIEQKLKEAEKPLFEEESRDENMTIKFEPLSITTKEVKSQVIENNVTMEIDSNNSL